MSHDTKTPLPKGHPDDATKRKTDKPPAAGPHAKPHLTDKSKTPGSGTLPDPERPQDGDATSG